MVSFLNHLASILYERGLTCKAVFSLYIFHHIYSLWHLTSELQLRVIAALQSWAIRAALHHFLWIQHNKSISVFLPPTHLGLECMYRKHSDWVSGVLSIHAGLSYHGGFIEGNYFNWPLGPSSEGELNQPQQQGNQSTLQT